MAHRFIKIRDKKGRFAKKTLASVTKTLNRPSSILIDHNYEPGHMCSGEGCENCPMFSQLPKGVNIDWKQGRRLLELFVLLDNLQTCGACKLGPVPLTLWNVVGERKNALGGWYYVKCLNPDCGYVNKVGYGKRHLTKETRPDSDDIKRNTGRSAFVINTKLGAGK